MVRPSTVSVEAAEVEPRDAGQLFRQYGARIRRWAARLGEPLVDSDDVVQEVFAVVHRRLAELPPGATLASWLYKVTQNIATSRRRRERLRRWLGGLSGDYAHSIAATADVAAAGAGAVRAPQRRGRRQRHRRAAGAPLAPVTDGEGPPAGTASPAAARSRPPARPPGHSS